MVINLNPILSNGRCLRCLNTSEVQILITEVEDGVGPFASRYEWIPCKCDAGKILVQRRYADRLGILTSHVDYPMDGAPGKRNPSC